MEIIYRTAMISDAADMAVLNTQLGYPSTTESLTQNLEKVLILPDNIVFVAEHHHKVVGWTNIRLNSTIESGTVCEIWGLIVDEAYRGNGIGKELIQRAKEWTKQQGINKLRVRTNVKRKDAHRFYFREGFTETKEQKSLEINL
ncbi:MAG: GNAT family N-acetyltransferase [Sphingobacteriales bacterium]|nr:GNAT family N-acetyltransferase [Sphingobacteriales bacterium]MBI3717729.1 GNAT family N-acetyltransferase [Sphingobacteriales bacterium]